MRPLSTAALQRLDQAFREAQKRLYLVGGSVRDTLLGRAVTDYDFATDARPEEIRRILTAVPTENVYAIGERFGTVCATLEGCALEITSFRGETYADASRKPDVVFGVSLEEDLGRRDFTMNAMAEEPTGSRIVDPFGGRDDLSAGIIRAVGDPDERFREDPLRLLRAVRFATTLEMTIERATAEAIRSGATNLRHISQERVAEEMNRLLLAPVPSAGIRLLVDLGLMPEIVPEFMPIVRMKKAAGHRHKDVYNHVLQVIDKSPPTLDLRWAAFLHDIAKPATYSFKEGEVHFYGHETLGSQQAREILSRLHMERSRVEKVTSLVAMHMRINTYSDWSDGAVRRFMREAGEILPDLFSLSRADITSHRFERVQAVLANVAHLEMRVHELEEQAEIAKMQSPLDGHELMTLFGRPPGPWLGAVKGYLLDLVLDGDLDQSDKTTARRLAEAFLSSETDTPETDTSETDTSETDI